MMMEEVHDLLQEVTDGAYDAADMPFDFVEEGALTAMVCVGEATVGDKLAQVLEGLGYRLTRANSAREALKRCRFHVYDVIILDELFDTADPHQNVVLTYLAGLPMAVRRGTFVCLLTNRYRTTDKMAAFAASVNLVVNKGNLDAITPILKGALTENAVFYRIFRETLKKLGRD